MSPLAEGAPFRFDCPMCSRVQKIRLAEARCESCGAQLRLHDDLASARRDLAAATGRTRLLRELPGGLFVVADL